ncbi:MAG TPA: RHS repeat-associated core domain-containing protein [Gemmatimonadaceae bacterium]
MRQVASLSSLSALLILVGPALAGSSAVHNSNAPLSADAMARVLVPRNASPHGRHHNPRVRIERVAMSCSTTLSEIDPCTHSETDVIDKTGLQVQYKITNMNNLEDVSYVISTTHSGEIVSATAPTSLLVTRDSFKTFFVTFATGATPGGGGFTVTADDGSTPVTATATITVTNPPSPPPIFGVSVTPHSSSIGVDPSASASRTFSITNTGSDTATIKYTRTCGGSAIASGCTPSSDSVTLGAGASSNATISFTASATANATGSLLLKAWNTIDTLVRDSGTVAVTVARDTNGVVDIASANPGSTLERSLCLHVSVAKGTSYECGALRLAYALPTTTTLTNARTPVLLYNSQFAAPHVVIAANVTLPDSRIPDSVSARLLDSVGVKLDSAKWGGSNWTPLSTRRIALIFDPVSTRNYPTGVQRYSLEVTRVYAGVASRDTVAGEFFVVRRDHDQFGPGWWLAGLERLYLNPGLSTMFWVGGDGSARKYVHSPTNPNAWGAANVDRPDTVRRVGNRFVRYLPHGLKVQFDTVYGCHMETVNRLSQTTSFAYTDANCGRLSTITLAPSSASKVYTFSYTNIGGNWRLARVDAPTVSGQARFDSLNYNANVQVSRIRDVYGDTLGLRYRASYDPRLTEIIDQRGDSLTFAYYSNTPSPLVSATIPLAAGSNAITTFTPVETRGLQGTAPVSLDQSNAKVDGPRTDVGDTTLFWFTALGAPNRIRDALGNETSITYGSTTFPGVATRVLHANGQILAATYDSLGHVKTVTDSTTFRLSPLKYATTSYSWDPAFDFITRTINPEGDSSTATYDATDGNALTEKDGAGHQVTFAYYTTGVAASLLRTVQYPSSAKDSLAYDSQLGNLTRTISALGTITSHARDDAGRVVSDTTPNDSTVGSHITRHLLDLLDRDSLTIDSAGSQVLHVRQHFDQAGNVDTLWKWSTPDPISIGTEKTGFVYDRANRKITETLIGFQPITWTYDEAGNVTDGGRRPTVNVYDALNRRIIASGSEAATYGYDAVGHLVFANNSYARIARTYNANGTLATDTLRIATADSTAADFSQHVYGIRNGYDLDGRRIWIKYPGTLAPTGNDSASFAYDRQTGVLDTVRDVFGNQFRYNYDADGRMIRLTMFAQRADSVWETDAYDADSRLVRRQIVGGAFTYHSDSLIYNRLGRVVKNSLVGDSVGYSSYGWLKYALYATAAGGESASDDALGNHVSMLMPENVPSLFDYSYLTGSDRMVKAVQPAVATDTTIYTPNTFGAAGDQLSIHHYFVSGGVVGTETRDVNNTYDAQQLLISSRYQMDSSPVPGLQYKEYHRAEFYRYDALGRRIFQRLVLDTGIVCTNHDQQSGCKNQLTRTVWDGDQILYEIRAVGDTTGTAQENDNTSGSPLYGNVGYMEGLGIDRPLELFKGTSIALPFTNWRGLYDIGACPTTACSGSTIEFPQGMASSYGAHPPQAPTSWWGSIITGNQDGSGYQYRRNRYYDPTTGRFTQEDPAGLAGGLNAYGFANNDPITYTDPFGLDPWWWQTSIRVTLQILTVLGNLHVGPLASPRSVVRAPVEHPVEEITEPAKELGPDDYGKTSSETAADMQRAQGQDAEISAGAKVAPPPPSEPFGLPSGETLVQIPSAAEVPVIDVAPAVAPAAEGAAAAEGFEEVMAIIGVAIF